jgi:hypothetical protein
MWPARPSFHTKGSHGSSVRLAALFVFVTINALGGSYLFGLTEGEIDR